MGYGGPVDLSAWRFCVTCAFVVCGAEACAGQRGVSVYAPLKVKHHIEVSGTISFQDSRYFVVEDFRFLGQNPAVWWATTKDKSALKLSNSIVDESLHLSPQLKVEVLDGISMGNVVAIALRSVQGGEELAVAHLSGSGADDATHSWRRRALMQSGVMAPAPGPDGSAAGGGEDTLAKVHGWLMAVSFGVLFPIGIGIARNLKFLGPAWFYVHVVIQSLGYLLGLAGFICGWVEGGTASEFHLHRWLGISAVILFTLQFSAFARPTLESSFRRTWNLLHWWGGRIGLGLAVANIYEGLLNVYSGDTTGAVIAYSVVLGVVVGGFMLMEAVQYARLPPPAALAPRRLADDVAGRFTGTVPDELLGTGEVALGTVRKSMEGRSAQTGVVARATGRRSTERKRSADYRKSMDRNYRKSTDREKSGELSPHEELLHDGLTDRPNQIPAAL